MAPSRRATSSSTGLTSPKSWIGVLTGVLVLPKQQGARRFRKSDCDLPDPAGSTVLALPQRRLNATRMVAGGGSRHGRKTPEWLSGTRWPSSSGQILPAERGLATHAGSSHIAPPHRKQGQHLLLPKGRAFCLFSQGGLPRGPGSPRLGLFPTGPGVYGDRIRHIRSAVTPPGVWALISHKRSGDVQRLYVA